MLTVAALKEYGADTGEGLNRCMNNEAFYLRLVKMVEQDTHLDQLEKSLAEKNLDAAFENAHALKGVLANLALTPALKPVSEMTELLRARTDTDYSELMASAHTEMDRLLEIIRN